MPGRRTLAGSTIVLLLTAGATAAADPSDLTRTPWRGSMILDQWRPGAPKSPALDVPRPITRDEQVQRVSLKEAIALALGNNPGIAARRLEPVRQSEAILQAQGQFDPTLSAEVQKQRTTTPSGSLLAGAETLTVDDRYANARLWKRLRSGTLATVDFLNDRLDRNSSFDQLQPAYKPELRLSIVQPLLQNFGWDFSYLVVRVAEQTADAAVYQYQAQLADFVQQVIEAYWNVVGAREQVEVEHESKALADRTVAENEARVRVGLLAPVAVLEAQADAALRVARVIVAETTLTVQRQQLAQLAYYSPGGTFVPRTLEPVEEAALEDLDIDLDETITAAVSDRPEIEASARGVQVRLLNEKISGNALLPQLNVVGGYGVNGLSGTNNDTRRAFTSPTPNPPNARGATCVPQVVPPGFPPSYTCYGVLTSPFAGSAGDAYRRLESQDFQSYSFGLQFNMPLSNATARSEYTQSRIARSQAELNHRELLSQVTLEARQTVAGVLAAREAVESTRVARELATENLKHQEKRQQVGMATTKDLLDFQLRRTTARAEEVRAKTAYMISVGRWRRATAQLLQHYQIVIEQPGKHSPPWFARF